MHYQARKVKQKKYKREAHTELMHKHAGTCSTDPAARMATTLMSCWSTRQGTTQRSTLHQPAQAALWQQHMAVSHDTAGTRHYAEPRSQQGPCPTLAFNTPRQPSAPRLPC